MIVFLCFRSMMPEKWRIFQGLLWLWNRVKNTMIILMSKLLDIWISVRVCARILINCWLIIIKWNIRSITASLLFLCDNKTINSSFNCLMLMVIWLKLLMNQLICIFKNISLFFQYNWFLNCFFQMFRNIMRQLFLRINYLCRNMNNVNNILNLHVKHRSYWFSHIFFEIITFLTHN